MSVPILPPWSGGDTGTQGGAYPRPGGGSGYQPPTGPGGGAGTPGINPGSWWDILRQWLRDIVPDVGIAPNPNQPGGGGNQAVPPGTFTKPQDFAVNDGPGWLGIAGQSVGVYLVLLLLLGLGVWGLLEGSGGAVGYVAAPKPFARPRK